MTSASDTPRLVWASSGIAIEHRSGQAYSEEVFRYLLDVELKRAVRSQRTFLLMTIEARGRFDKRVRVDSALASRLFSRLWLALRESDFVGWYREGLVVGALLTRPAETPSAGFSDGVRRRMVEMLSQGLWFGPVRGFRLHVWELPRAVKNGLCCHDDRNTRERC